MNPDFEHLHTLDLLTQRHTEFQTFVALLDAPDPIGSLKASGLPYRQANTELDLLRTEYAAAQKRRATRKL